MQSDRFIKNKGITETMISNHHNHLKMNRTKWEADYDGNKANILIDSNTDGKHKVMNIELDNRDLANLLSIPSVNSPIDKRLAQDFCRKQKRDKILNRTPTPYIVEIDDVHSEPVNTHISSPLPNEEFLRTATNNMFNPHTKTRRRRKKHRSYKLHRKKKHTSSGNTSSRKRYFNKTV
uniref:Uncharacterized protein n=1 Tax=viral metagenome TaxID=1070528 RepID=A0A6C0LKP5_9ZZZZ